MGAGSAEGSLDAANILKPALSRGEIQCVGATTPAEFRKTIEKDRSLERRFQAIKVPPPSEQETIKILEGIKDRYEMFHQIRYTDDAIETAVYQSNRYIPDRFLPDKAIDIVDEAGARVNYARPPPGRDPRLPAQAPQAYRKFRTRDGRARFERAKISRKEQKTRPAHSEGGTGSHPSRVAYLVAEHFPTSPGRYRRRDLALDRHTDKNNPIITGRRDHELLRIEDELHKRIINQDRAISRLSRAIRRSRAGLKTRIVRSGPSSFSGPPAVGKTEVARSLADFCSVRTRPDSI